MAKILNPVTITILVLVFAVNIIAPFFELNEGARITIAIISFLLLAGIVVLGVLALKQKKPTESQSNP